MKKLYSEEPIVTLEGVIQNPYDLAVATARTCYSSKGIIRVEDVNKDEPSRQLREKIAQSTLEAGHLTTRQHAHFVFSIQKVSRQAVWSFLHSHPFYNSEQVSQRYVKVKSGNWTVPALEEPSLTLYQETLQKQTIAYEELIELIFPKVAEEYYRIFPIRKKWQDKYRPIILKKSYELARYALPVATHTYLYHTINSVTLLRYWKMMEIFDAPVEQKLIVQKMMDEVLKIDPEFKNELSSPYSYEETPEYKFLASFSKSQKAVSDHFIRSFDDSLEGSASKLIDYKINSEKTVADAVRNVFGLTSDQMSDTEALHCLTHPSENRYLAETLGVNTLSKLSRCLVHAHYTFRKKISHTADSQDQRHRTTPASRPILQTHYTGKPDYITPKLITLHPEIEERYRKSMDETFNSINLLLEKGVSPEAALYLLPNAFPIRFEESGDLLNLHHKWHTRSCYTAQDEIFYATIQEIQQASQVHPKLVSNILAPCFIRKQGGVKPVCPEGERFCGVKVWEKSIEEYERLI